MKIALRSLLLLLLVPLYISAEEPFREMSLEQAMTSAAKEKKVVIVDFFASWCGPCKMMDKNTFSDEKVREWIRGNAVAVKVDGDKNRTLSTKYRIGGFPTVVMLKPDGKEIERLVGYRGAADFLAQVKKAAGGKDSLTVAKEEAVKDGKVVPAAKAKYAGMLAERGQYAEALEEYRWCLENGFKAPSFAGFAATGLIELLARLGTFYAPATELLKKWRDSAEKDLIAGNGDPNLAIAVAGANRELKEPERSMKLFEGLKDLGPGGSDLRVVLLRDIVDQFLALQRYEEIVEVSGDGQKLFAGFVGSYENMVRQAGGNPGDKGSGYGAMVAPQVVSDTSKLYAALLGAKRRSEADALAQKLTEFLPTAKTYAILITRAKFVGDADAAKWIEEKGMKDLAPAEQAGLKTALGQQQKKG